VPKPNDKGIAGFTNDPVGNFWKLIGERYAEKVARLFSNLPPAAQMAEALDLLERQADRDIIKSRIGLDGPIPTFQAIADRNGMTKAAAYDRYVVALRRLREEIDELHGA
jgi:hypothetical protein